MILIKQFDFNNMERLKIILVELQPVVQPLSPHKMYICN